MKLGREEYLQRLVTTLIVGGEPRPWNTPMPPSEEGRRFLQLLDNLAHGEAAGERPAAFVDEYLLPKLEETAANGWPDWAVLARDRAWVIELKTEAGSHRDDQLPYYLRLAAAAHPGSRVDLTYITGPLTKPAPALAAGQRYSHLQWTQVVPLIETVWSGDPRPEVRAYVAMVRAVIENLTTLRPSEQRKRVLGAPPRVAQTADLLALARATADDAQQRGVGASSPTELEDLRDEARAQIGKLPADDPTRLVLPWLWTSETTDGSGLTPEGREFGYELRFSRYKTMQVRP